MNRYFETLEDFNTYTENGTRITAGDLYFIKEVKMLLKTNNFDGTMQTYDMIEPTGNIEITENGEDIDIAQYASATVNVAGSGGNEDLINLIERDITSITIPSGTTRIGTAAFSYCSGLTSVTIPNSVTSIGLNAFQNCTHLTSIIIPSNVTSIADNAFNNCTGLTSVTIGSSVTSIGSNAFYWCTGLTSVTIEAVTPPSLSSNAFTNTNNCPIYVPAESVDAYKAATNWSDYASRIQAIA